MRRNAKRDGAWYYRAERLPAAALGARLCRVLPFPKCSASGVVHEADAEISAIKRQIAEIESRDGK